MNRTITVKGMGRVAVRPDYVTLSMNLERSDPDYKAAGDRAAEATEALMAALVREGFPAEDLKTESYHVRTDYGTIQNPRGIYEQEFLGYTVCLGLNLGFDFTMDALNRALGAVTDSGASPELHVSFSVKDPASVRDELLRSAAENARRKAQVLCAASGKNLGELLSIDYNWNELPLQSGTVFDLGDSMLVRPRAAKLSVLNPGDVEATDTASFVWEML